MSQDVVGSWVKKNKHSHDDAHVQKDGVKVIRRQENRPKTTGETIMFIADKIWPSLMKLFADVRDENGLMLQPAHVRGIALNVAQNIVKNKEAAK